MHDSKLIGSRLVDIAAEHGNTLTPMQLLKLVYIAHGWMLGLYGVPLIRDRIEAWKYGPVIPNLYHAVKHCRDSAVPPNIGYNPADQLGPVEENLLSQIYNIYGKSSGISLSNLTHQPDTPWDRVYRDGFSHIPIPNDTIQEHYAALANGK
ncbi:MAG: Panacea domain-containing protein [Labrenzia sp.]